MRSFILLVSVLFVFGSNRIFAQQISLALVKVDIGHESDERLKVVTEILSAALKSDTRVKLAPATSLPAHFLAFDPLSGELRNPLDNYLSFRRQAIDMVLYYRIERTGSQMALRFWARDFISGHFITTASHVFQSVTPDTIRKLGELLHDLITNLVARRTMGGFSFSNESGMAFIAYRFDASKVTSQVSTWMQQIRERVSSAYFKFIELPQQIDLDPCDFAAIVLEQTNAKFAILLPDQDHSSNPQEPLIIFPHSSLERPIFDVDYPFFPRLSDLNCYPGSFDKSFLQRLSAWVLLSEPVLISDGEKLSQKAVAFSWLDSFLRKSIASTNHSAKALSDTLLSQSLSLLRDSDANSLKNAWLEFNLAVHYQFLGRWSEALSRLQAVSVIFENNADMSGMILSTLQKARLYREQQNWEEAESQFQKCLGFVDVRFDTLTRAKIYRELARIAVEKQNLSQAQNLYEESTFLFIASQDLKSAGEIYSDLGHLMRHHHQLEKSLEYFHSFLKTAQATQNESDLAQAHLQLGIAEQSLNRHEEALDHLTEAAKIIEILDDDMDRIQVESYMGEVLLRQGKANEAKESFENALRISEEQQNTAGMMNIYLSLGNLEAVRQNWTAAEEYYQGALHLAQGTADQSGIASIWFAKGLLDLKQGNLQQGYEQLQQAIQFSDGSVIGSPEHTKEFMRKLQNLIDEIQNIRQSPGK